MFTLRIEEPAEFSAFANLSAKQQTIQPGLVSMPIRAGIGRV
jgi:hypothetical protein